MKPCGPSDTVANGRPFTVTAKLSPAVCAAVSATMLPFARSVSPPLVRLRSRFSSALLAAASAAVSTRCTSWAAMSAVVCVVNVLSVDVNDDVRSSRLRPSLTKPASASVDAIVPPGPPSV